MFEKTRRSLTVFFSLMLALILLLMTVLFYVVLNETMHRNQNAVVDGMYESALKAMEHRKKSRWRRSPWVRPSGKAWSAWTGISTWTPFNRAS
ncbi:hypothetical protein LJK88_05120 [Paenibacillus sp. P26]|nr:hypothetical protein LJK88_05120 [Paenibacillus sp. P26]UUZ90564.1 hypothetical protein LJK87_32415 [Paenibacillus sp. P25]